MFSYLHIENESNSRGNHGTRRERDKQINGDWVIDIEEGEDGVDRSRKMESSKGEKVCRICHFSKEPSSKEKVLISLGCDCKGELGSSHRHCAQAWFAQKGDRICEICGKRAENVKWSREEQSISMMERNASLDYYSSESSCGCTWLCNMFLGWLILLVLLVLLRVFQRIGGLV